MAELIGLERRGPQLWFAWRKGLSGRIGHPPLVGRTDGVVVGHMRGYGVLILGAWPGSGRRAEPRAAPQLWPNDPPSHQVLVRIL